MPSDRHPRVRTRMILLYYSPGHENSSGPSTMLVPKPPPLKSLVIICSKNMPTTASTKIHRTIQARDIEFFLLAKGNQRHQVVIKKGRDKGNVWTADYVSFVPISCDTRILLRSRKSSVSSIYLVKQRQATVNSFETLVNPPWLNHVSYIRTVLVISESK